MKKIILTLSCMFLLAAGSSLAAADETPVNLLPHFGVEGGINLSSFNGPTVNSVFESRLGFVGGLFLRLPLGPSLVLQPEFLYEQKGGKINGNDYRLDYAEVPFLLNVDLIGPLGILVGPSFGVNVGEPAGSTVNSTDVGLVLGAQVSLPVIFLSGRYEVGLMDLNSNSKIQNGTFTILVGLALI